MSGITRAQSALINAHCQVEHSDNQSETSPSYNLDGSIPSSLTNANRIFGVTVTCGNFEAVSVPSANSGK